MRAEIVGFEALPSEVKAGLDVFLRPYGARVHPLEEHEVATSGLIVATRQDMIDYNRQLDEAKQFAPTLVGRCWETPHYRWARYRQILENPSQLMDYNRRFMFDEPQSVHGFRDLFADYAHMNMVALDRCLKDGMTTRMSRMGPKMDEFLRAFARTKLQDANIAV